MEQAILRLYKILESDVQRYADADEYVNSEKKYPVSITMQEHYRQMLPTLAREIRRTVAMIKKVEASR